MSDGHKRSRSLFAVAGVVVLALSGCGSDSSSKAFRSVQIGMSEKTVRSLLGKPSGGGPGSWTQAGVTRTCWEYAAGQVGNFQINRYQVCFRNGKVVEKQHF